MPNALIQTDALALLVAMATAHIEDIESGIADGTYEAADNQDLAAKKEALRGAERDLKDTAENQEDAAAYVAHAQECLARDGDLEFDDGAVVSIGSDDGAYVMAWKWVARNDVPGLPARDEDEDEDEDED